MFTHKLWLLAIPVAALALQGCGGGGGLTKPTATPTPAVRDNIGRYSNLASTNGANNIISSELTPAPGFPVVRDNSQILLRAGDGSEATPFRDFIFQTGSEGFTAGQSYALSVSATPSQPASIYTQPRTFLDSNGAVVNRINRNWEAESGTFIVDAVTPGADNVQTVDFRIVNARYRPIVIPVLPRNTDPRNQAQGTSTFNNRDSNTSPPPDRAQGTFTFNYKGSATGPINR